MSRLVRSLRRNRWALPAVALAHDAVMAGLAALLSLVLRTGTDLGERSWDFALQNALLCAVLTAGALVLFGVPRRTWRFVSVSEVLTVAKAVSVAALTYLAVTFLLTRAEEVPRSFVPINWLVTMLLLLGPRFAWRLALEGRVNLAAAGGAGAVPVLLVGAGPGAALFLRAMSLGAVSGYRPLGIVDERERAGHRLQGVPVLGRARDLDEILARFAPDERPRKLVVTDPGLPRPDLLALVERAAGAGLGVARLPRLNQMKVGADDPLAVEPVAIEDVLGRPQTVLDMEPVREMLAGARVLVTGAGGTIGGELARQIAACGPAALVLVDASEYALYRIDLELGEEFAGLPRRAVIADVRDRAAMFRLLAAERPDYVFHAAALKHVHLVEANPTEGLLTNAIGTRNVADACRAAGVRGVLVISTDKAVNPPNIMGASKRAAECYAQALDAEGGPTRFVTVRFGNVLGSTGSVVPLFQRQLARGGPLTVTDPNVRRYFMTQREAMQLVLTALRLGVAGEGERGRLFVLDMGEPVAIIDLARQMIRLAGLRPDVDVKIEIVGLRPGEKLEEELFYDAEGTAPTSIAGVMLGAPQTVSLAQVNAMLDAMEQASRAGDRIAALSALGALVPEYRPAA